ncbi:ribosome-inactivating family protein, partial [uncultured Marivita sp.]|uniref:ribosome-inactivating family protein n=2 Tax=Marivita TaxID=659428 RepID=UPI0025D5278A
SSPWLCCNSMEYQNGQPVLGRAPARAHDPQLKRISRHEGTVPGALEVSGPQRNQEDKKAFVSLIFITSEAARFEPFARHINSLIRDGDGAKVLDYERARFYMNNWMNLYELTHGAGCAYFKPLTEANMHNWNYYHDIVVAKTQTNMNLPFSATQASLRPKALRDLR